MFFMETGQEQRGGAEWERARVLLGLVRTRGKQRSRWGGRSAWSGASRARKVEGVEGLPLVQVRMDWELLFR
jgi:hypothetical protein